MFQGVSPYYTMRIPRVKHKQLVLFAACLLTALCTSAASRPNVIVIMTDDTGNNIGFQGNPHVSTPHIDQLASEAVNLSNFHQMPMCTASRAGLMSGQYAEQTGAWRTSLGRTMMRGETYTIAEAFKDNGYATGHYGKWHLGDNWPMRPQDQGFDDVVGLRCGAVGQIADFWDNDYFDDTYYRNGSPEKFEGYCTDIFFNETMRFIREHKEQPFFIYLAPNITHLPLNVAEKYSRPHVENGIDEKLAILYGMIDNLDENVGRLMACLKETGLDENTIILMTTDDGVQGAAVSRTPDYWNMGLRGRKGSQEEGGHRVFSYLRWPGGTVGAGTSNNTLISVQDVFPTLLDLCGLDSPAGLEFSGRSFMPYLTKPLDPRKDDRAIFFYYFNPKKLDQRENQNCVIWKNWRLLAGKELYDISTDPMQENDLAAKYSGVVKEMNTRFDAYHARGKQLIKEPIRFVLGDPRAQTVELTSQDVYWTKGQSGAQAFSQKDARNLKQAHGPYKVTIARPGTYTIKLSRYPLYTELPLGIGGRKMEEDFAVEMVRLSIAGQTIEKAVTPQDTHALFTLELKAGDTDLDTALVGDGKDGVAYFVTIESGG
jgi:arylsulfatase A-like enzyme